MRLFIKPILAISIIFTLLTQPALASEIQTFAVLPFTINADKDISYVKEGISRMLYSRLSWPDKVQVIPPVKMDQEIQTMDKLSGDKLVASIANKTDSQYVLSGSITQLAGSFSIDAKVYDIANKRYMAFFEQSKQSDDLIEKVDRIAATINQKVFNRSTVTWEMMEKERQEQINDYKRKNPEYLMQVPAGWQPQEKIGWKVWKYLF